MSAYPSELSQATLGYAVKSVLEDQLERSRPGQCRKLVSTIRVACPYHPYSRMKYLESLSRKCGLPGLVLGPNGKMADQYTVENLP